MTGTIYTRRLAAILKPVVSALLGLALGLTATYVAGERPWNVFKILVKGAVGTPYDLGMTLFYATPLIFTGLSVAIGLQAGLFNIGAEGQLAVGAIAAAAVGIWFPSVPWPLAPALALGAAFAAGALWGAIPGWLKARRGSHEVINTIMLNFVAAGVTSFMTLDLLKTTDSQNAETRMIGANYILGHIQAFGDAPVSAALVIALAAAVAVWIFMKKTVLGYEFKAVGANENAARFNGIEPGRVQIWAMSLAGGLAGLVAAAEVLGNSYRFKMGFSPDYGFMGVAVALLGRGQPGGIVVAALLFGALHRGTAALDLETDNVSRDLSQILQACIILVVAADGLWDFRKLLGKTLGRKAK